MIHRRLAALATFAIALTSCTPPPGTDPAALQATAAARLLAIPATSPEKYRPLVEKAKAEKKGWQNPYLIIKTGGGDPIQRIEKIAGVKGVIATVEDGWQRCSIRIEAKSDLREDIFRLAVERRWIVRELTQERATLEDVFVELTHTDD